MGNGTRTRTDTYERSETTVPQFVPSVSMAIILRFLHDQASRTGLILRILTQLLTQNRCGIRLGRSAISGVKPRFNCAPKGLQKRLPASRYSAESIDTPRVTSRLL